MYNGRTGEQIKTEIFIGPTYYQRLKHMVADKIHCLTKDHEVLTMDGWKPINEITTNDKVATLTNNVLNYENPIRAYHYPEYNGLMYKISDNNIDLDVTINHRMYIQEFDGLKWSPYKLEKAEDILHKTVSYKKNAKWTKTDYELVINNEKIDMKLWLKLFGILITYSRCVDGIIYIDRIQNELVLHYLTSKLNIDYNDYGIVEPFLYNYLNEIKGYLPEWIWELSTRQARIVVDYMNDHKNIYNTDDEKKADDYMRLLIHSGWNGNKSKFNDGWKVVIIKQSNIITNGGNCEIYNYSGAVYCLQVPSEVFMVRRNGKAIWTGNSRGSNGPIVMLTRQCSEGRARGGGLRLGEMERDCFIGHGTASFLKEKMLDCADNYRVFICKECGMIANVNPDKNIYKCNHCKNATNIVQIRIPYAFKLLTQELYTMNVIMRYICNN
jgi:hypothetical protein